MDTAPLSAITASLRKEREALSSKASSLQAELEVAQNDLARIDAALLALSGGKPKVSSKAPSAAERKKPSSPSPTRSDVTQAMVVILKRAGVLDLEPLKAKVEESLAKKGFNRSGLAMRFKEACQDNLFVETPGGIRLSEEGEHELSTSEPSVSSR